MPRELTARRVIEEIELALHYPTSKKDAAKIVTTLLQLYPQQQWYGDKGSSVYTKLLIRLLMHYPFGVSAAMGIPDQWLARSKFMPSLAEVKEEADSTLRVWRSIIAENQAKLDKLPRPGDCAAEGAQAPPQRKTGGHEPW